MKNALSVNDGPRATGCQSPSRARLRPFLAIFCADDRSLSKGGWDGGVRGDRRGMAGMPRTRAVAKGGRSMEEHSVLPKDQIFIRPLRCEECGGNAHLIRRSPHFVNCLEIRTFECQECGHQMERIVKA